MPAKDPSPDKDDTDRGYCLSPTEVPSARLGPTKMTGRVTLMASSEAGRWLLAPAAGGACPPAGTVPRP